MAKSKSSSSRISSRHRRDDDGNSYEFTISPKSNLPSNSISSKKDEDISLVDKLSMSLQEWSLEDSMSDGLFLGDDDDDRDDEIVHKKSRSTDKQSPENQLSPRERRKSVEQETFRQNTLENKCKLLKLSF